VNDWVELHDWVVSWVDGQIAAEPDPEAQALFIANRDTIIDLVEAEMERDAARHQGGAGSQQTDAARQMARQRMH
jgi:hypothetical protein